MTMSKELEQYIDVDDGGSSEPVSRDEYEGTMIGTSLADLIDDLQSRKEESAEAKPAVDDEAAAEGNGDAGSASTEDSEFVIVGELDLGDLDLEPAPPAEEPRQSDDFEIVTAEAPLPDPSDGRQSSEPESPAKGDAERAVTGAVTPQAEAETERRKGDRRKGDRRKGDRQAQSNAEAQSAAEQPPADAAVKASALEAGDPPTEDPPTEEQARERPPVAETPSEPVQPARAPATGQVSGQDSGQDPGQDSGENVDLSPYTRQFEDMLRRCIEEERQRANARIMHEVGRAMDAARKAVKKKTTRIEARLQAAYAEKEAALKRDSEKLLNLANKVAQQKAEIQRARAKLEQNLKAAGQLHTQVNEICSTLGERIDNLGEESPPEGSG